MVNVFFHNLEEMVEMNISEVSKWLDEQEKADVNSKDSLATAVKVLKGVLELADLWDERAKYDRNYAATDAVPEDIKDYLYDKADEMAWSASMIRFSITKAMKEAVDQNG